MSYQYLICYCLLLHCLVEPDKMLCGMEMRLFPIPFFSFCYLSFKRGGQF